MSAKSQRLGRIEGEMQRVLSTLVSREVRDPRVGNVTITTVSVAPDMSTSRNEAPARSTRRKVAPRKASVSWWSAVIRASWQRPPTVVRLTER